MPLMGTPTMKERRRQRHETTDDTPVVSYDGDRAEHGEARGNVIAGHSS